MFVFPNDFEKITSGGPVGVREFWRQNRHAGGEEYNSFNETLSLRLISGICSRLAQFLRLLTALSGRRFGVSGFGEIAGAIVQFEILLAQRRIDQLDFDAAI